MKGRKMRLPNGYGGVVKLSGNRRRPYAARITTGWHINDITGKRIQHYQILGYAPTRSEALQILENFLSNAQAVKALPIFPFTICGSMICNL